MRGGLLVLLAVAMSTPVAADAPAATSRVRRVDRDADADQPPARESTKRRIAQRWEADVANATLSGGGKNAGRKQHKFSMLAAAAVAAVATAVAINSLIATHRSRRRRSQQIGSRAGAAADAQVRNAPLEPAALRAACCEDRAR